MHARITGHKGRVGTFEKGLVADRLGYRQAANCRSQIHINPMNCRTSNPVEDETRAISCNYSC